MQLYEHFSGYHHFEATFPIFKAGVLTSQVLLNSWKIQLKNNPYQRIYYDTGTI